MKLFLASALAALSAKNASAWRIVQTMDDTYCIMVVPYDSTVWTGAYNAPPATATATDGDGPTVGPNGVLDPTGAILTAAQAAWGAGAHTATASITYYEAGGTTAMSPQPDTLTPPPTLTPETSGLGFCKFYSTTAPSHYCKADGAYDTWQKANWGDTIDDCCQNNHASEYNTCFETSAGVPPAADAATWFADHSNKVCNRVCDVDNLYQPPALTALWTGTVGGSTFQSYECGGLLSYAGQSVYSDAASCCADAYGDQNNDYCTFQSTLGLATPTPDYPGTLEWYGDSAAGICVPDCPSGSFLDSAATPAVFASASGGTAPYRPCGGIIKDAFTKLYADSAACCTGSSVGPDAFTCEARSDVGDGVATGKFFAGADGCYSDCTGNPNCKTAPASSTLYATASECCQKHFSWLKEDYCTTRAASSFDSSAAGGGTNLWYVDYQNGVCKKDCYDAGSDPECEYSTSGGLSLGWYGSAADCCKNKLPSVGDVCAKASIDGTALDDTPTLTWYVTGNYDQPCAKDCAVVSTDLECGGIKAKNGDAFYADAATCCKTAFSWVNSDLCEDLSADPDAHTNLWYVSYQDNICHKDCDPTAAGAAPSCKGSPGDLSTPLYADETTCCARMGWIEAATCAANSLAGTSSSSAADSGPGTGQWRKNDGYTQCVLDCKAGETMAAGDPILTVQPLVGPITNHPPQWTDVTLSAGNTLGPKCDGIAGSWQTLYGKDLTSCCKSLPASIQLETCQALSLDIPSQMYFVNPSDRSTCVAHQAASSTGTPETYIACASGVVSGGSNGVTGVTCNPTIDLNTKLYSTLDDCCDANVSWDKTNCVYKSQGASAPGTLKYYVDWSLSKCAQDCPEASGGSCAGIANTWETLYNTAAECFDRISWVAKSDALYVQP